MEEMRLAHRAQRCVNNVPWELVLNFDQLWKSAYEPPTKVFAKRRCREANLECLTQVCLDGSMQTIVDIILSVLY